MFEKRGGRGKRVIVGQEESKLFPGQEEMFCRHGIGREMHESLYEMAETEVPFSNGTNSNPIGGELFFPESRKDKMLSFSSLFISLYLALDFRYLSTNFGVNF
jgi:hypothetical protein